MNKAEAEALLATGIDDAAELVKRWEVMSTFERRDCSLEERKRFGDAWDRLARWPSASALARSVLGRTAPATDTLEAMWARRRERPLESRVSAQDVLCARRSMGPLDDDREPDVVEGLEESTIGPGWLRGERP